MYGTTTNSLPSYHGEHAQLILRSLYLFNRTKLFASDRYPTNSPPSRSSKMAVEASMDNFRFLDLPKDIRLTVYERLPAIRRHSTLSMLYNPIYNGSSTLVLTVVPLAILRVPKMSYDEVYAIPKLKCTSCSRNHLDSAYPHQIFLRHEAASPNFSRSLEGCFQYPVW
jgi:hypothetical protein